MDAFAYALGGREVTKVLDHAERPTRALSGAHHGDRVGHRKGEWFLREHVEPARDQSSDESDPIVGRRHDHGDIRGNRGQRRAGSLEYRDARFAVFFGPRARLGMRVHIAYGLCQRRSAHDARPHSSAGAQTQLQDAETTVAGHEGARGYSQEERTGADPSDERARSTARARRRVPSSIWASVGVHERRT